MLKVMVVMGTRPEAIKLAPVVRELRARREVFQVQVCVTAQHREMLDQVLDIFSIRPDFDLKLMEREQTLAGFAARALAELDALFRDERPGIVLVQGDTSTTLMAALAAFYRGAKVAHVEAGLRTFDKRAPFPEEINRTLVTDVTDVHFAPTQRARQNLLREGIDPGRIFVTGNTIVDALMDITARLESGRLRPSFKGLQTPLPAPFILVTVHRRENHGRSLRSICWAIRDLIAALPDFHFVFPIHLSPSVQGPVRELLDGLPRVHLLPPIDYVSFIWLMQHCTFILSDSGGVQEEAPSLRKHVLVMREVTERPEAVESGWAQLVGSDKDQIVAATLDILREPSAGNGHRPNPFGDGTAARRTVEVLCAQFNSSKAPVTILV